MSAPVVPRPSHGLFKEATADQKGPVHSRCVVEVRQAEMVQIQSWIRLRLGGR